jgi:hypothetical protein
MKYKIVVTLLVVFQAFVYAREPQVTLTISQAEDYPGVFGPKQISYERITGKFTCEIDTNDSHNAVITDIKLAEKNSRGLVEYTSDFILLKPKDMSLSNGILRYDAPNRGSGMAGGNQSLMAGGYVLLSAAWQGDVAKTQGGRGGGMGGKLYLDVPVAKNPDGSEITGIIRVEWASSAGSNPTEMGLQGNLYNSGQISYEPAGFPNNKGYILTKRIKESDPRRFISNSDWTFATTSQNNPFPGTPDPTKISVRNGFDSDYLYELIYTGKNPRVMGIGLAAIRDIVSFFKDAQADSAGVKNPVAGKIKYAFGTGTSQSGNFMKTFIHLGFNESLNGKKVFDAVFPIVAARQTNINMRFAVPGGGGSPRSEQTSFGQTSVRAFSSDYYDDITGSKGGIFSRSDKTNTTPKVFMLLTAAEIWDLQGSRIFTDAYGQKDIDQPEKLRIYYIAGAQHSVSSSGSVSWTPQRSVYPGGSMVDGGGVLLALWAVLEDWVVRGSEPPESQIPTIKDKTLVFPEELKFPTMKGLTWNARGQQIPIPEFKYLGIINRSKVLDFGPEFNEYDESGITTFQPPAFMNKDYAIMVSQIDEDGNEKGGVRTPDIQAPTGTSFGFNYDARIYLEDLTGLTGAYIPFHKTKAEREAAGDSRLSLEERYGNQQGYIDAVTKAANKLVSQRLLLQEDADRVIEKAKNTSIF